MANTFNEYQYEPVSEKNGLVRMNAKLRLIGWVNHAGDVYKFDDSDYAIIDKLEDSGTPYTEVSTLAAVSAGKFFNDRVNKIIYVEASDSSNPNSRYLVLTFKLFYSNFPTIQPWDLATGEDVYWEPMLKDITSFTQELDHDQQLGQAIEAQGTISLVNDVDYWTDRFEIWSWDNQEVEAWHWHKDLPITEAKKIFEGRVQKKSMRSGNVMFIVKDFLNELRTNIELLDMSEVVGARITESEQSYLQRRIYGRVYGRLGVNIDQVLDEGYPITGTVSIAGGAQTITGIGSLFLKEFTADDRIVIVSDEYTIKTVTNNTSMIITEEASTTRVNVPASILPDTPKRYINRKWRFAGHALKEPVTTISDIRSLRIFQVDSNADFFDGDDIYVNTLGAGEVAFVEVVKGLGTLDLVQSMDSYYPPGTVVRRPAVQNVQISGQKLQYYRDYTFNAATAELELNELAEFNVSPIRGVVGTVRFNNGSNVIDGTGTAFGAHLKPGYWIKPFTGGSWFEVLFVESDTKAYLRANWSEATTLFVDSIYKPTVALDVEEDVLTVELLGMTADGTTTGEFLSNGPQIVEDLLTELGYAAKIDAASFSNAKDIADHMLGFIVPSELSNETTPTFRDVIDKINVSIFGSVIQNQQFLIEYNLLSPKRPTSTVKFQEHDILQLTSTKNNDLMAKTAKVEYQRREHDFGSGEESFRYSEKTSNYAKYVTETSREKPISTYLADEKDAVIFAARWAFISEYGSTVVKIKTKMQGSQFEINDLIDLTHEKFYRQLGVSARKIAAIQSIKKGIKDYIIELEDLSNAFSRCGIIAAAGANNYDNSTEDDKLYLGFYTDGYGIINNDRNTYGRNLHW